MSFTHSERSVANKLGVQQKDIRAVRANDLVRGRDWELKRTEVCYSDAGLERLMAALKIKNPAEPGLSLARAEFVCALAAQVKRGDAAPAHSAPKISAGPIEPPRHGDVRELTCLRTYSANKRIVLAAFGGHDARVRVRDSVNLIPGMPMQCRFLERDLWELAQRLPRWRGKW